MKNIEQCTVVHGVECCTQIKQDECSNFTKIHRTNDIIRDTHYSSHRVMMLAVWELIRWKQSVTCAVNLVATTRSTNLEVKLKFDIGRYELASSASNVVSWKTRADLCFNSLVGVCQCRWQGQIGGKCSYVILRNSDSMQIQFRPSQSCVSRLITNCLNTFYVMSHTYFALSCLLFVTITTASDVGKIIISSSHSEHQASMIYSFAF